jgi:Resolvase, N terminal domain
MSSAARLTVPPEPNDPAAVRTVVCYLRTANPGSAGMRLLGRQRARLQAACAAHGWTVVAWAEDLHQSGTTLNRPACATPWPCSPTTRPTRYWPLTSRTWPSMRT